MTKQRVLNRLKLFNWTINAIFIYYLIYNTYFGWNFYPINDLEKTCDTILKGGFYLSLGFLISTFTGFMQLVIESIKE